MDVSCDGRVSRVDGLLSNALSLWDGRKLSAGAGERRLHANLKLIDVPPRCLVRDLWREACKQLWQKPETRRILALALRQMDLGEVLGQKLALLVFRSGKGLRMGQCGLI